MAELILLIIIIVEMVVYLILGLWTAHSYIRIPQRIQDASPKALIRMPDVKLFVAFIKACAHHHFIHAVVMTIAHGIMIPHMLMMSIPALIFIILLNIIIIATDYRMAKISDIARRELRLD